MNKQTYKSYISRPAKDNAPIPIYGDGIRTAFGKAQDVCHVIADPAHEGYYTVQREFEDWHVDKRVGLFDIAEKFGGRS